MSYTLSLVITNLCNVVSDKIGILSKPSNVSFEAIPAIGFGIPTITSPEVISNGTQIQLEVPVRIISEGDESIANLAILDIYEDFVSNMKSYLPSYLSTDNIGCSFLEIGRFEPMVGSPDSQMVGLDGTLTLIIEV